MYTHISRGMLGGGPSLGCVRMLFQDDMRALGRHQSVRVNVIFAKGRADLDLARREIQIWGDRKKWRQATFPLRQPASKMSFSVDDLVSSLSSSHIGQEAIDLAALQAQLAETLFGEPSAPSPHHHHHHASRSSTNGRQMQVQIPTRGRAQHTQPCNTPTARTPSSSFSARGSGWGNGSGMESRRASSSSSASYYGDDMEEDERMVEELLIPSSPMPSGSGSNSSHFASSSSSSSNFSYQSSSSSSSSSYPSPASSSTFQAPPPTPSSPYPSSAYPPSSSSISTSNSNCPSSYNYNYNDPSPSSPSSNASLFTTTDPFYIAQLQASQAPQQQQYSGFAQHGRAAPGSPFALPAGAAQYHQMPYHAQGWGDVQFKPCAAAAF
ncbi:hypothetical protein BDZ97DRAFT_1756606 [Flammula alnicola]|nr:hypothetical protein BDZ97DRAFT_1756606 [Flammula alnicola]